MRKIASRTHQAVAISFQKKGIALMLLFFFHVDIGWNFGLT
jgi:hypothetical protein